MIETKHTITRDEWLKLIRGESVTIGGVHKAANKVFWMEVVLEDIGITQMVIDVAEAGAGAISRGKVE